MMRWIPLLFLIEAVQCKPTTRLDGQIGIKIDSVYVNEVEKSDTVRHELLVVYYCTIKNPYDSVVNLQIKNYPSEERPDASFYLLNSGDTLNLYLITSKLLTVPSHGESHFGVATDVIAFVDLFE